MTQKHHTHQFTRTEEAITVLFCLIDDAYANLNPRGRRYESLKRLSNSGDITLTLFQQLRGIESGRDLGGDACLGQYLAGGVSKGRPGGGGLEHALIELLTDLLRHQGAELFGVGVEAIGHLTERSVAQTAVSRPGQCGVEGTAGGGDRCASLALAPVRPLAEDRSCGRVDRFRDEVSTNPFTIDPVPR
jgi:hypothetical protein